MARLLYVETSSFSPKEGYKGPPIVVEPTLDKPESVERTKAEAAARARSAAGAF